MDAATAALIGAGIGAVVTVISLILNNRHQLNLETTKSHLARDAELDKVFRDHIVNVAQEMLSAAHTMEWLCWYATKTATTINDRIISNYHEEIHTSFPRLMGYIAVVASIDQSIYEKLQSLAEKLYVVDGKIADILENNRDEPDKISAHLKVICPVTSSLYRTLPQELTEVIKLSQKNTNSAA